MPKGIATTVHELADLVAELTEQRDALLAACKAWMKVNELLEMSASLLATPDGERIFAEARLQARAAISRATGAPNA